MSVLKKATTETTRLPIGDEGDWLEVRAGLSKRDFNRFVNYMPTRSVDEDNPLNAGEAMSFATGLFEALVISWSAEPTNPSVNDYLDLEQEAAGLIDSALMEHFQSLTPSQDEVNKGFRSSENDGGGDQGEDPAPDAS